MSRKNNYFDDSLRLNRRSYIFYLERLMELAMSMFEWRNVPDSVDTRFIEKTLFQNGCAVYFNDEVLGDLVLPVATNGKWNVYNIPTRRRAYATNGYQKELTEKNSVIIYNNMIRTNSELACRMYARRLYSLDSIIDVNANAQKTPVLVQGSEQQYLTVKNLAKEYDGNAPFIFGDKNLDINALKAINTGAPFVADKIYELKTQIWNEALTFLGINNTNYQKKERMISDEVLRNQGSTIASRYSRLNARRQAADEINKMFGTNIEVNYREDYREVTDDVALVDATESETKEAEPGAIVKKYVSNETRAEG